MPRFQMRILQASNRTTGGDDEFTQQEQRKQSICESSNESTFAHANRP